MRPGADQQTCDRSRAAELRVTGLTRCGAAPRRAFRTDRSMNPPITVDLSIPIWTIEHVPPHSTSRWTPRASTPTAQASRPPRPASPATCGCERRSSPGSSPSRQSTAPIAGRRTPAPWPPDRARLPSAAQAPPPPQAARARCVRRQRAVLPPPTPARPSPTSRGHDERHGQRRCPAPGAAGVRRRGRHLLPHEVRLLPLEVDRAGRPARRHLRRPGPRRRPPEGRRDRRPSLPRRRPCGRGGTGSDV